jgi:SOS-response transcriptional repressor LexA
MKGTLSRRQDQVLQFIKGFIDENGIAPAYTDMRNGLDIASKGQVFTFLNILEDRGHITREHGVERGIVVVEEEEGGVLRQIRDAATAFVGLQTDYRKAFEVDATSKEVKDKAPGVAAAFNNLKSLVGGGA